MSRSGYHDDHDSDYPLALWRGAVASSIRGKRGQAFLKELLATLDAMPEKRLAAWVWDEPITGMPFSPRGGEVCALGAVTRARGIDTSHLDPEDSDGAEFVASTLDIAPCLAREIVYENDEHWVPETPEQRWQRMRNWVDANIKKESP